MLSEGSACVSELATEDQLSTVSQRLKTLRTENLVTRHRDGKHLIYELADDHVMVMIENALHGTRRKARFRGAYEPGTNT